VSSSRARAPGLGTSRRRSRRRAGRPAGSVCSSSRPGQTVTVRGAALEAES